MNNIIGIVDNFTNDEYALLHRALTVYRETLKPQVRAEYYNEVEQQLAELEAKILTIKYTGFIINKNSLAGKLWLNSQEN